METGILPPIMIFVQSKERAQALYSELRHTLSISIDVLHAGRSKQFRDRAVSKFRSGETLVLICTDLMTRGVDFKAVHTVVNYDLPVNGVQYVHRIGRTGRAGRTGEAITLFTEVDFGRGLRDILNVAKLSGNWEPVEDWMLQNIHNSHHSNKKKKTTYQVRKRRPIGTVSRYDKHKTNKRKLCIEKTLRDRHPVGNDGESTDK